LDGVTREVNLEFSGNELLVDLEFFRLPELEGWVSKSSNWLNNVIQRKSLIVRVHHSKKSGSVERSNWSVFFKNSPCVHGSVSASGISVGKKSLLGNGDGGNGDIRSISFQPFNRKIVDGVEASILLELELEVKAIILSSKSVGHINGQVIHSSSSGVDSGIYSSTRVNSVLNSSCRKWVKSKFEGRNSIVRQSELRNNGVILVFSSTSSTSQRISSTELSSESVSSSTELSSGHNSSSKYSFVVEGKDGECIEDEIVVGIVFKSRKQLLAWDIVELEGKTLSISSSGVLSFLIESRKSHENGVGNTRLEDTSLVLLRKVSSDGKGSVDTSNSGEVESSSVVSWKISLGLQLSDSRVQIVDDFIKVTIGEGRLLSQN